VVKVSGTSTVMTGEATSLVSGNTYRITNAAKRVIDPAVAVVVKDGGTPVTPTSIDYLFGAVTLPAPPGGAVTVDAAYLPIATLGDAKSIEVQLQSDLLDKSAFGSQAKAKLLGLQDATASVGRLSLPIDDLDADTGGVQSLDSRMKAGTAMLLDWLVDGTNRVRGWFLVKSYKVTAQVAGLIEVSVDFEATAQAAGAVFGIGT
jgi:hypothetical protein